MTLEERLTLTRGRPSGFDYLRIALALLVALVHIPFVTYDPAAVMVTWTKYRLNVPEAAILPMFFALSGFLVAGSLERCRTLPAFLGLRMLRIFPALAVEIALSALILGALVTTFPLRDYIAAPEFRQYFLNMAGVIHMRLPGVFLDLPNAGLVNAQLWTIPFELLCYLAITALAVVGVKRWRIVAPLAAVGLTLAYAVALGVRDGFSAVQAAKPGPMSWELGITLVWAFLWGVTLYLYRDKVPWSRWWFLVGTAASLACLAAGGYLFYLAPLPLAYVTIYLGLTNAPKAFFLKGADYSYGVFLYHWVIMQTVMGFAPHHWLSHILISLPLVIAFAALSWHLIEKPAMEWKRPLIKADVGERDARPLHLSIAVGLLLVAVVFAFEVLPRLS